jgi:hypothetical protein
VVGTAASKEAALDNALAKMQADWQGVELRVVEYKDTGTAVIGGTDDVQVGQRCGVVVCSVCRCGGDGLVLDWPTAYGSRLPVFGCCCCTAGAAG